MQSGTNHENEAVWKSLTEWIQEAGGLVHSSLALQETASVRGVYATRNIAKGELLIRLPASCVISGERIASSWKNSGDTISASPWLRCIAAYYESCANVDSSQSKKAYRNSLPTVYETLWQWTDTEIQTYLAGTTLGTMVQADRQNQSMQERYRVAVRPFLEQLQLLPDQDEYPQFLQACMCLSTRGFHLTSDNESSNYRGPFLLPVIDLLNHDPARSCTTLQRDDATGVFAMRAERDIAATEQVLHSYGDTLTSAQLLQTFGFVPTEASKPSSCTPVVLNKNRHLVEACQTIKSNGYSQQLQEWMSKNRRTRDEDEVWEIAKIPNRTLSDHVSEDLLVSMDDLLSEECITLVVAQFLPSEAYDEICPNDEVSAWLDGSILEDLYLGKLVCHALQEAIRIREAEYTPFDKDSSAGALNRDRQQMNTLQDKPSTTQQRAMYGLKIRIEELTCLQALSQEVKQIEECLDNGWSIVSPPPPPKRARVSSDT